MSQMRWNKCGTSVQHLLRTVENVLLGNALPTVLGEFTKVCVLSDWDIIILLQQQHYLDLDKQPDNWILDSFFMCQCKPLKQYKHKPAMPFQKLSLHHVNILRVKQCSHHCQWMMVNDVDIAVDTQSNLPEVGLWGTKLETTNPMATKQSQYHYRLHLNKQMATYQAIFIPSETVQETTQEFFVSSERQNNRV